MQLCDAKLLIDPEPPRPKALQWPLHGYPCGYPPGSTDIAITRYYDAYFTYVVTVDLLSLDA